MQIAYINICKLNMNIDSLIERHIHLSSMANLIKKTEQKSFLRIWAVGLNAMHFSIHGNFHRLMQIHASYRITWNTLIASIRTPSNIVACFAVVSVNNPAIHTKKKNHNRVLLNSDDDDGGGTWFVAVIRVTLPHAKPLPCTFATYYYYYSTDSVNTFHLSSISNVDSISATPQGLYLSCRLPQFHTNKPNTTSRLTFCMFDRAGDQTRARSINCIRTK